MRESPSLCVSLGALKNHSRYSGTGQLTQIGMVESMLIRSAYQYLAATDVPGTFPAIAVLSQQGDRHTDNILTYTGPLA